MEDSIEMRFMAMRQLQIYWWRKDKVDELHDSRDQLIFTPEDQRLLNIERSQLRPIESNIKFYRDQFERFGSKDIRVIDLRRQILDGIDSLPPIPKKIKFKFKEKIK